MAVASSGAPAEAGAKSAIVTVTPSAQGSWRPAYLRLRIFTIFCVLFCAIFASLEILNQVSRKQHGLASAPESRRYLWTYGPTAVLIIIAAFWSRVEYQAKQSAPWTNLMRQPDVARKTVLLDYVSVTQIGAFRTALLNGNYGVAITITCSGLLKLLIIFSTGLLSLGPVEMRNNATQLILRDSFTTTDPMAGLYMTGTLPYNILTGVAMNNLSYPEGTNAESAFQWFSSPGNAQDVVISAEVDSFSTGLDCEPAEVDIDWSLQNTYLAGIDDFDTGTALPRLPFASLLGPSAVRSPGCEMYADRPFAGANTTGVIEGGLGYWGVYGMAICQNSTEPEKRRVLLSVGEYTFGAETPKFDPANLEAQNTTTSMRLNKSTSFVCKPTYAVRRILATIDSRGAKPSTVINEIPGTVNTAIDGLDTWDMFVASFDSINSFQNGTGQSMAGKDSIGDYPLYPELSFDFEKPLTIGVLLHGEPRLPMEDLFDADTLLDTALQFYQGIGAQVAHKAFKLGPKDIPTLGSIVITKNRLLVRELSLRAMEAFVLLAALLTAVLALLAPRRAIATRKISTIGSFASVVAWSPSLRYLLAGTGAISLAALRSRLSDHAFQSSLHGSGRYEILATPISEHTPKSTVPSAAQGTGSEYRPITMSWLLRISFCIVLIALIAALEAVTQTSQRNDGLGDVTTSGYKHYIWTYIPTLIMVSVGVVVATIDFPTRTLSPYLKMKSAAGAKYRESLGVNFLDNITPITLIRSVQTRHLAVLATTLASVIASFLPIIISGLYSVKSVPQTKPIRIQQETWFTNSASDLGLDPLLGIDTAGLIIHGNLTDPQWTYNDLALPELSITGLGGKISAEDHASSSMRRVTLTATIPATRSNLTCRTWEPSEFQANLTFGFQRNPDTFGTYDNLLYVVVPGEIYRPIPSSPFDNETQPFSRLTQLYMDVQPNSYFGMGHARTRLDESVSSMYQYMWGEIGSLAEGIKHISIMTCNETLEQVDALTTFFYPDMQIDRANPPVPDEAMRRRSDAIIPETSYDFLPNISTPNSFDRFFGAVIHGKNGVPVEDLGRADAHDKVAETIAHMHKIVRTQQLNEVVRTPLDSGIINAPIPAMLSDPNRLRLVQDAASTRALEALLACILLLIIAASVLMPQSKCGLPKNPCSIAAMASYFADSAMLDAVARDPDVLERGGWRFRLGWYEKGVKESDPLIHAARSGNGTARSFYGIDGFVPE